jgi:hypothetical protein
VRRLGLNFGAPGDRRGPDGTLWVDYPSVGGRSPDLPVDARPEGGGFRTIRHHASRIAAGDLGWVASSALVGSGEISVRLLSRLDFTVPNEIAGGSPLRVQHGLSAAAVAQSTVPGTAAPNGASLAKGGGKGALSAVIEGDERLAPWSITVELWAKVDADVDYVDARAGGEGESQGFVLDNRKLRARYFVSNAAATDNESAVTLEAKAAIPDNQWVHIAFTYDACTGIGTLYQDGAIVASHDGPDARTLWWDTPRPRYLVGKDVTSGNVLLDELRICAEALPPGAFLRAAPSPSPSRRQVARTEQVAGYWRMSPEELPDPAKASLYSVRLVFAELEGLGPGERVFDVVLQGRTVLEDFDIARAAGGAWCSVVLGFDDVAAHDQLRVRLVPKRGRPPLLGGIEMVRRVGSAREF